jgi:predicted ester cyclase
MSKAVVREYVARFNRGDTDGLRELYHEHAQVHEAGGWLELEAVMPLWEQTIDGLGVDLDIERIIAEDEAIALLYTERGWSRSPFGDRPATGRSYELAAVDWFVIEEGRIVRQWRVRDRASQARQLGWEQPLPARHDAAGRQRLAQPEPVP